MTQDRDNQLTEIAQTPSTKNGMLLLRDVNRVMSNIIVYRISDQGANQPQDANSIMDKNNIQSVSTLGFW
ncbi:hypothetical protein HHJ75_11300 [Mobiluncus mulieris]|nr:hypothetical protein [Mobiluncus mulieris]NMX20724.1 hypothetical protein [Mobiluncus mulieris]